MALTWLYNQPWPYPGPKLGGTHYKTQYITLSELTLTPFQPLTQPEVVKAEDDTDGETRTPAEINPAGTTTNSNRQATLGCEVSSLLMCRDCIWLFCELCAHFAR